MNTLYINRLTTVDCALLIGDLGSEGTKAFGFSFNVSCNISGELDPTENVIVDFGTLKKAIKAEIDNLEYGYDHKLIFGSDYDDVIVELDHEKNTATILDHNQNVLYLGPKNSVRPANERELSMALNQLDVNTLKNYFLQGRDFASYSKVPYKKSLHPSLIAVLNGLEKELRGFIQQRINTLYPNSGIKVDRVDCDIQFTMPAECFYSEDENLTPVAFSQVMPYTHGLKNSTSIGCKNLMHGHLSHIVAVAEFDKNTPETQIKHEMVVVGSIINFIALELFNTHFVWGDNLKDDGHVEKYTADGRGEFTLLLGDPDDSSIKSIVSEPTELSTESTIENLAGYIERHYGKSLTSLGIKTIYVSEGLQKGSYINVKSPRRHN